MLDPAVFLSMSRSIFNPHRKHFWVTSGSLDIFDVSHFYVTYLDGLNDPDHEVQ